MQILGSVPTYARQNEDIASFRQGAEQIASMLPEMRDGLRKEPQGAAEGRDFSREMKTMFSQIAANLPAMPETAAEAKALAINVAAGVAMAGALDAVIAYVSGQAPHELAAGNPVADSLDQAARVGLDAARQEPPAERAAKVELAISTLDQGFDALEAAFPTMAREDFQRALGQAIVMGYSTGIRQGAIACLD